ncbi:hypothetical protein [Deinococcus sp. QL22]|uniref:hypothetical protein n=1 Tax=Deinococcus sp. QL22 TaxID=2939437 RepID=UPI0020173285|nr:hypothetical protein [Deinococcus sp. QL22]UQN09046.1 hypothetical protein M1R55_23605 [Deinococcus sp. QL22]
MTTNDSLRTQLAEVIAAAIPQLEERFGPGQGGHLDLIRVTHQARQDVDVLLHAAVSAARTAGYSWEAIGQVLGLSKQAAQQRFSKGDTVPSSEEEIRRLTPLTAFNEMDILNRAGVYGWHSVGFGTLYHDVQKSDEQWEHRRVLAFDPARSTLEGEGWQLIGTLWFPWAYLARPTGQPALPPPPTELDIRSLTNPRIGP